MFDAPSALQQNTQSPTRATPTVREQIREEIRMGIEEADRAVNDVQRAGRPERAERPERPEQAERPEGPVVAPGWDPSKANFPDPASFPTGTGQPMGFPHDMIPPQVVDIAMGFFMMCAVMVVGWPLARAFGRRIERGGSAAAGAVPAGVADQLQRIEQAVEAMSVEVERISESQRFLARLQNESGAGRLNG